MAENVELTLIHNEIQRLCKTGAEHSLSIEDVRKLELLLKTRQFLLTGPQMGESLDTDSISDEDVLNALRKAANDSANEDSSN